jgi:AcrR family transcriptional regulator
MTQTPEGGTKRERTRARLIEIAWAVVRERGFAGASLDEIAARAGMTKGAIYSNFDGKADLMLSTMKAHAPRIAPRYTAGAPLRVHLRQFAEALLAELPGTTGRVGLAHEFQVYIASEPALRSRVTEIYKDALAELGRGLQEAHGEELRVSPETLALACQALGLGFMHQSLLTPELVTKEAVLAAFETLGDGAGRGET